MTSNLRPKPDRRKKKVADVEAMPTGAASAAVSEGEIARKAFELYCARGGQNGSDIEDWLRAERELMSVAAAPPQRRAARRTATLG